MDEYLASTLNTAVVERLDYLDRLVTEADAPSRAALAETEIARMTEAWRALLQLHAPNEHGRCPECSGWRRPRRHPCTVWTTAHQHLIAADGSPAARAGRHAAACRTADRRSAGGLLTGDGTAAPNAVPSPVH